MMPDLTDQIISYETGSLDDDSVSELFQHLIDTGLINQMGDRYGLIAQELIVAGVCNRRLA